MRCRADHGNHEKERSKAVHSPRCYALSTLLFFLSITYFPLKILEYIDLLAIRFIKPAGLSIGAYTRSKLPLLKNYLVKVDECIMKYFFLIMERLLRGPGIILESLDHFAIFLKKRTLFSRLSALPVPYPPLAGLSRRPMLKSAVALIVLLIFSLYSYAFNTPIDTSMPINASLTEPKFTRQVPVETGVHEKRAALLSPAPTPPNIDSFKLKFDSKALLNISRGSIDTKEVSLTFDGGTANHAREILQILRAKEIETTIFLTGRFIRKNPEIVMEIVADGHEVGNHTMSHPHLTDFDRTLVHTTLPKITKEYFLEQILSTAKLYREVTGLEMAPYWRAPYGEVNPELTQWGFEAGFFHVGWTADYKRHKSLDTLDWVIDKQSKNYFTASEIRERILDFDGTETGLKGGIILMHLGTNRRSDQAVSVLPAIIDDIRERGYCFVKISRMARAKITHNITPKSDLLDSTLALINIDAPSL